MHRGQLALNTDPAPATPNAERMASDVVTDPNGGSGVALYPIDEWHRLFGKPRVAYGQMENDA